MEVESIVLTAGHPSALDTGSTQIKVSALLDDDEALEMAPALVAPPIPLRSEVNNDKVTKTKERRHLFPTDCGSHVEHHSELNGILICAKDHLCPPLPPREPLRRSVSLTHRPPPPPTRFLLQNNLNDSLLHEPTLHQPLTHAPIPPRTVSRTLARSAPLLDQVIPVSRWPLRERPTHVVPGRPVHVIPLTRWPLPEATGRLAMDCIVTKVSGGNEYVDSPTLTRDRGRHMCSKGPGDRSPHPVLHLIHPISEPEASVPGGTNGTLSIDVDMDPLPASVAEKKGLILKLQRFMRRMKRSTDDATDGCKGRTICRRCGRCCCPECTRSNIVLRCCGSERGCSAESVIDVCSCMCCVRPIFYHCLKDENGEEDCSEEPCACCGRPHCALRWTIMALLAPCLPCLCCYLPMRCALRSCRAGCGGPGCHCPRNLPPGIKGLLESESSSA